MKSPALAPWHIRHAEVSDLDALVALEQRSFSSDRMSRRQYRRHLRSDSARVMIAIDDSSTVLGSTVLFFRTGQRSARLYSLTTRAESRGLGIGRALILAMESEALQRSCLSLRLEVRADNAAAIRLYEQLGYRRLVALPHYYEDGADGWRYEKRLDGRVTPIDRD